MPELGGRLKYTKKVPQKEDNNLYPMEEAFRIAEFVKQVQKMAIKGDKGDPGQDAPIISKSQIVKEVMKLIRLPADGKDGYTPQKGVDYLTDQEIKDFLKSVTPIKGVHYKDGENGTHGRDGKDAKIPDLNALAINTINMLESLQGDDRLDAKAIKNLDKYIRQNWGGPGIVFHDSTLTGSGVPGDPLEVVRGAAGGIAFETPVGLINSSNVTFTVSNVPSFVVLNGLMYFINDGYTLSGLTITMLVVPMTGSTLRSAY